MLFAVHDDEGRITQANKVFDPTGYDKLLDDYGYKWASNNSHGPCHPDHTFVWHGEICNRPEMPISVSKKTVKAGSFDSVVFKDVPAGAKYSVSTMNVGIHGGNLDTATEFEISIPVPCIYRVMFEKWPFKTFTVDIEAVS